MIDLQQWRADPIRFIQTVLHDPELKQPFVLLPAERDFLQLAFSFDADGRCISRWFSSRRRNPARPRWRPSSP